MKTAVLSIKVDEGVKQRAKAVAAAIGIPLGTIINAYLVDLATTGVVHFAAEPMTPKMEKIIEVAERERAEGKVSESYNSAESAISYLQRRMSESE